MILLLTILCMLQDAASHYWCYNTENQAIKFLKRIVYSTKHHSAGLSNDIHNMTFTHQKVLINGTVAEPAAISLGDEKSNSWQKSSQIDSWVKKS